MAQAIIKTETFTCPSCVKKIEKAVGSLAGVSNVEVRFNSSRVKVDFDPTSLQASSISHAITELGYEVLSTAVR